MKPRFCLIVPTYNNPRSIAKVVDECLTLTEHPVLVIDDGSEPALVLPPHPRLTLFRFAQNLGKGAALQKAFALAIGRGFTHAISIDGDGQHLVHEVSKLVEEAILHPWSLIIGARALGGEHVPEISRFGRKFSNFWVKFETSKPVRDSQSGFRIYPFFFVQNFKFWTKRFDFEIEILIRLMWNGVSVREVDVDVHYPPAAERVSHFDKLWDNVRISLLNAALVTISLLRVPEAPIKIATAVALGVMVGTYPVYGLHTVIVAGVALLFRLNFIALVLGTQISVPPMIPVIFFLVYKIKTTVPFTAEWAKTMAAFGILAAVFAVTAFFLTLIIIYFLQKKRVQKSAPAWSGKTRGGRLGNGFMKWALKTGGIKTAYFLIAFAIPYFYFFAPKARSSLNQYWKNIRPELGFFKRQIKINLHFYRFAQVLLDRAFQAHRTDAQFEINSNGIEHILDAVNAKTGLVMVTAHVGAWDLASFVLRKKRGASDFRMVKYEAEGLTYDKASGKTEEEQNHHLTHQGEQASSGGLIFQIRDLLQKGLPVGLMADRPVSHQIELVKFMGKLAIWDMTPIKVAKLCRVPLISTFGFKGESGQYDFYASPAIEVIDPYEAAKSYCNYLEELLGQYPDQWFNFFPFWPEKPADCASIED